MKDNINTHEMGFETASEHETYLEVRDSLSNIEVKPLTKYTGGLAKRVYPHLCFDKAFHFMKRNAELMGAKYVEGVYTDLSIDHAWVEIGEVVFDGTMQRFYDKALYYKKQLAVKIVEYDYEEMWNVLLEKQQKGFNEKFERKKLEYFRTVLSE